MSAMQRHGVTQGSRAQILAELDALGQGMCQPGQGCHDQGRDAKVRRVARAWHAIEAGADRVELGHSVYIVIEG